MKNNILIIVFLILDSYLFAQQTECRVMLPAISGTYTGECKKGLAHGKGIAQGIDRYEGNFFKGLPEGEGTYKWANGSNYEGEWKNGMRNGKGKLVSRDSVVAGFWKGDRYQGLNQLPSYKITLNRNVARFTVTKVVESVNSVRIKLLLGGRDNTEVENFSLAFSGGSEYRNTGIYGIENYTLPVDVTIRYTTWNQLHTTQYDVVFEFTLYDPGSWDVTLTNM
jgi:hypothetical protein